MSDLEVMLRIPDDEMHLLPAGATPWAPPDPLRTMQRGDVMFIGHTAWTVHGRTWSQRSDGTVVLDVWLVHSPEALTFHGGRRLRLVETPPAA
ncbi:MAG: hypothetical protein JSR59_21890 [Proteobacteria bacterium]|nr:hypothetical protein [Pseudomonadota bacterium]